MLLALDPGDFAALALLDLSAAFDTVDHSTLLHQLQIYGIYRLWFSVELDKVVPQFAHSGTTSSQPTTLRCGVPQGSVLGPILFLLYMADLFGLITKHGLHPHLFDDDTKVNGFCVPTDMDDSLHSQLSTCVSDIGKWMSDNRLQLNAAKTDIL